MNHVHENLKKSCQDALLALQKLNKEEYKDILSKLEWCLGSYEHDHNPSGLFEYGIKSLDVLKNAKAKQPKQVTKKVIENLEKSILNFSEN
ncbi:MAG: hypothetical protein FJY07_14065 [Bacteroidetes bacterium]|nr:hypothetical protein [Bacteroidota bacterium]